LTLKKRLFDIKKKAQGFALSLFYLFMMVKIPLSLL